MRDFVKIDRGERPAGDRRIGARSEGVLSLLAGETLFFDDAAKGMSLSGGWRPTLLRRGYRVVTRRLDRDGVRGLAVWAEPIEPNPEAPR